MHQRIGKYARDASLLALDNMRHIIRLSYPWKLSDSSTNDLEFFRSFNRPAGLVPGQKVWLVLTCTDKGSIAELSLNHQPFTVQECFQSPAEFEVGWLLKASNRLLIRFRSTAACQNTSEQKEFHEFNRKDRVDISSWASITLEIDSSE